MNRITHAIFFSLIMTIGVFVFVLGSVGCQRSKYPVGNIKDPADAPPYTVSADKDPIVQVK